MLFIFSKEVHRIWWMKWPTNCLFDHPANWINLLSHFPPTKCSVPHCLVVLRTWTCSDFLFLAPSGSSSWCLESAWLILAIGPFLARWCCWQSTQATCVRCEDTATWRGKNSWNWRQKTRILKSSKTDVRWTALNFFFHSLYLMKTYSVPSQQESYSWCNSS